MGPNGFGFESHYLLEMRRETEKALLQYNKGSFSAIFSICHFDVVIFFTEFGKSNC